MMMNDYFLSAPVETALVLRRLAEAKERDALNFRLCPDPPRAVKNTAYAISCKVGIWNRAFLRDLAMRTKSAWEFERYGSFEVGNETKPLLVTSTKEFPFVDAVHKGHWEKFGVAVCRENGVEIDFSKRGLPPFSVRVKECLKALVFAVVPNTWIVRMQNAIGAGAKERK